MMDMTKWLIESNRLFNVETTVMYPDVINLMPSPYDPSGWFGETNDDDGSITNVNRPNPSGVSDVGLVEQTGGGFLRPFSTELTPATVSIGEQYVVACIVKNVNKNSHFYMAVSSSEGTKSAILNINDGTQGSISIGVECSFTVIDDGYSLIQIAYTFTTNATNVVGRSSLLDDSGSLSTADIGDKVYMQAAFFGKADDFPALIQPVQVC